MEQLSHDTGEPLAAGGFRLDGLRVDPATGRIEGPGSREQVDPIVMAVLAVLVEEKGGVVTRAQLLDRVWHDRVVTEDVVSRCVYQLRQHLVRAGGDKRYRKLIETLPRRGYRLEGRVVPVVQEAETKVAGAPGAGRRSSRSHRSRTALLFVLMATLAAFWWLQQRAVTPMRTNALESPSIAVLPFSDLGDGQRDEYLAHGIADSLITLLARSQPNRVIARSSSFALAAGDANPAGVAHRLGASHIVEGSFRRNDDRVGVSVQLVDTATATTAWANRWEAPLSDLPMLETTIAAAIANELGLSFRASEPIAPRLYGDGDAYVDHLHARHLMHRRNAGDLDEAILLFERAVGTAPMLADAWAGLSTAAWLRAGDLHGSPDQLTLRDELMEKARQAGERALALEPDHVEALLRLSRIALGSGDFERATTLYVRARRAAPNDPTLLAMDAGSAFDRGDYDAAILLLERAVAQDPLATAWRANLAVYLSRAGRVDRAKEEAMRVIGLSDGGLREHMRALLVHIALHQGRVDEARKHVETIADPVERAYAEALLYSDTGESAASRDAIARLEAIEDPIARIRLAEALAFRGEDDAAISVVRDLERWIDEDTSIGQVSMLLGNIAASHNLSLIRDHPAWPGWTDQRRWTPPPRNDLRLVESR